MNHSPYSDLPAARFWKSAVAERHPTSYEDLYRRKFPITPDSKIATAGSCFAQHISRYLMASGFQVLDVERKPRFLDEAHARQFGFGLFSARYGNIYLARQLLQLARESLTGYAPADPIWTRNGRYFDAFRPAVEPDGLDSPEEVRANRRSHLTAVRELLLQADIFVFTFGLTEGWQHTRSETVFPTAPGTLAGSFDPAVYSFRNYSYDEVRFDFLAFRELLRKNNPRIKFLLTVSPVPLTATASDNHVLVASTHSKSVLRAVAGQLAAEFDDVDYFPSYEIISSPATRGFFFESNLRGVNEAGVEAVMRYFFEAHGISSKNRPLARRKPGRKGRLENRGRNGPAGMTQQETDPDDQCEEALLEAFAK